MAIIDYIFYRLYISYYKDGSSPRISASCYFSAIIASFLIPTCFLIEYLFNNHELAVAYLIVLYIFIPIIIYKYYNRKKIATFLQRYKNYRHNKLIPSWIFFLLLPLALLWAFFISGLIIKYVLNQQIIFAPLQ